VVLVLAGAPGVGKGREGLLSGDRWWRHEIILDEMSQHI